MLASNGYGGNRDMVRRHIPEMADALYFGHAGNQGDAVSWGEALGGEAVHMGAYQGHGSVAHPHGVLITWALMMEGAIQVNAEGRRFSNEHGGYSEQAVAVLAQPGGVAWNVYDERLHAFAMDFADYREAEAAGAIRRFADVSTMAAGLGLPEAALAQTLADLARDDPEARDRFLGLMQQQAQRMTRLVEDLLSLSRIELREHFAPTDPVALDDLLARAVRGLEMKAREAGVSLELKPVGGLPRLIGDADELEQVLQNLIDNAIKYGADGGRIEIGAAPSERGLPGRKGRAVRVWVRDWGPGIEPEHLPRLTERFYRVDTARSRALGGTGLGMAIVKHIVNRHRGQLTIESAPGEGSTFIVLLPAA